MKKLMMILCTILCANILAAQIQFTSGGLNYEVIDNNSVKVAGQNRSATGSVIIPSTVTYNGTTYSVTSIGRGAFWDCRGLTSVTIPNSVTSIGKRAFERCSGLTTLNFNAINCQDFELDISPYYITSLFSGIPLTTVNIGDSVQRIPANFVLGCNGLTSVSIPNSVTSIGASAFAYCSGLTTLNFNAINCQDFSPDYYYSNYPFSGTSLTTVNIGDSVQRIPADFVRDCSGLTSVTIPNSVTSIGKRAFNGCSGLTSVTIPNSVTSIGGSAFNGCSSLTTLNFNAINCQDFSDFYTFDTSLTTVNIGDGVQRIPANFVSGCNGLTSVTIPNSLTSIGRGPFSSCSSLTSINVASGNMYYSSIDGVLYNYLQDTLIQCPGAKTSVTIGNSVTSIGDYAFYGCSGLTSVTIPNSVTSIGEWAFNGCSGLTSVTIPNSVTSIGKRAFEGCSGLTTLNFNAINCQNFSSYYSDNPFNGTSLTTVNIGDSVQRIPACFVLGCNGLTSVTIPNGVTSIGGGAFAYCSGLTTLNFNAINCQDFSPDYYYSNYPFSGTSLTTVNIGDSVQRIPAYFVRDCSGLTSVTLPNSLTSIGNSAFSGCSGLTSVTIPNGVTSIGGGAFAYCSGLTTLNFNAINCQDFEAYYDYNNDYYCYPFSGTSLTTVNIGDSVQRIPANFVRDCSGLTSVTIPNSVTSVGDGAFNGCSGLTSVTIGNSVTSIGDGAFYGCSSLTSVTIPNSVTSIGGSAFNGCSSLTSVTIPNSVTSIGGSAFNGCSGLTSVTIGNRVTSIGQNAFSGCSGLTSVTIPNSVTSIGDRAFNGCSGLTSVTIGNSVTSIGEGAFYGCSGLTSVTIPNSVTSIGGRAFSSCSGLTSVTIGNSVTSIGVRAFYGCSGLTSVTIPNSVTSIGNSAFYGCSGLTTLNFNAINCQDFSSDYYDNPFNGTSLTTVNVGDSVQRIPAYFVRNCSGLTSVTIPTGVTSIGGGAFSACSGLTSVTIGNRVTSIGDGAFYECLNLSSLISSATVPPTIGNEAFPYPNICTVAVPCGSLAAYTASTCYWSVYFPQRITESSSFELSVSANEEAYGSVEVETQSCNVKTLTAIANEGYEFTAWNDGNTENPRTVTVTSDTAFVAIFTETETTPTITVTVNDATMGSATYTMDGNTAVLTATPNEGYVFTGWNDGNTENPRTVTVTSDTAFMAIFAEAVSTPTITLTVNNEAMGSATYTLDGNTAVLTATANEGYSFLTWSDGNTENPRTVTITSDTAFMAIFTEAVSTPTITVTVNDATMGSATYTLDGNTAVLTATANEGYSFLTWSDGNTENPRTVTVTSDTAFMAIFTASGSSSLQEVNASEFALYPNPAKSFATLEFEALQENTLLQIFDINGRRVRTLDLKAGVETLRIDLGDLPKGVYTIMVGNATKKLIVE